MRGKKSHFSLCRSLAASGWWLILCRNPSSPGFLGTPMNPMIPPPPHSSIPSLLGGGVEDGCAGYQKQIIITIILIVTIVILKERERKRKRKRERVRQRKRTTTGLSICLEG